MQTADRLGLLSRDRPGLVLLILLRREISPSSLLAGGGGAVIASASQARVSENVWGSVA